MRTISEVCGDAEFELAGCASGAGADGALNEELTPIREWLAGALALPPSDDAASNARAREVAAAILPGSEWPSHSLESNLINSCADYWWALRIDAELTSTRDHHHISGDAVLTSSSAPGVEIRSDKPKGRVGDPPALRLTRRLGCMLNELGQVVPPDLVPSDPQSLTCRIPLPQDHPTPHPSSCPAPRLPCSCGFLKASSWRLRSASIADLLRSAPFKITPTWLCST